MAEEELTKREKIEYWLRFIEVISKAPGKYHRDINTASLAVQQLLGATTVQDVRVDDDLYFGDTLVSRSDDDAVNYNKNDEK